MNNPIYKVLGKRGRITIPFEIRQQLGFCYNDIVSFQTDGNTVTVKREKLCTGCSVTETEMPIDGVTLLEFLDSLSAQEQRAALIHLSVKWAQKKSGSEQDE
jgi:bifunctional DNA-binding transcriptional regulator/antitoxin component of YhaV-PrlF toxin-antitoxin module